ncbi:hypothetical protein T11_16064, partial [Trichinella zimbabwensis]
LASGRQKCCASIKNFYKSRFSQLSRAFWSPATAKKIANFSKIL